MNQGSFVMDNTEKLGVPEVERLVKDVFNLYIVSASVVRHIFDERKTENKSDEALPPVVPHHFVVLPHSEFCSVVRTQQERILAA